MICCFTKEALKRGYDNEDERNLFAWTDDRSGHSFYHGAADSCVCYQWLHSFGGQYDIADQRIFGWRYGMVAGGVGAALADLLSGYAHWAPFTLIIKGVMGLLVGKIAHYTPAEKHFFGLRNLAGSVVGIVWMIIGYYFGGAVLQKSFTVALTSIPENLVQGGAGFVIFLVVGYAFYKAKIYKYVSAK